MTPNPRLSIPTEVRIFFFTLMAGVLTYGFPLTNYSLTVDSESPIYPDYVLEHGRWGTNVIRYQLFNGLWPYFTLLVGLVFLSLSAVLLCRIFRLQHLSALIFSALFISLPQQAYQLVFTMQADAIPIGFFCGIAGAKFFIEARLSYRKPLFWLRVLAGILLVTFAIAVNQVLVFVPALTCLGYFFVSSFDTEFRTREAWLQLLLNAFWIIMATGLYYATVKLFCPENWNGYLSSYASGESGNRWNNFYQLLTRHWKGAFYYGDRTYLLSTLAIAGLASFSVIRRQHLVVRLMSLAGFLLLPFLISFFITNGANPPRLYVASPIVFALTLTLAFRYLPAGAQRYATLGILGVLLAHVFFITNLFHSTNRIYKSDLITAREIARTIREKCPDYQPFDDYVYFHGPMPDAQYNDMRLPDSDVFAGSLFTWDGGNNWRIIQFFRASDIANYRFMDNKEEFDKVKDSVAAMPVWPDPNAVHQIGKVVIVKLSQNKGTALPFQQ